MGANQSKFKHLFEATKESKRSQRQPPLLLKNQPFSSPKSKTVPKDHLKVVSPLEKLPLQLAPPSPTRAAAEVEAEAKSLTHHVKQALVPKSVAPSESVVCKSIGSEPGGSGTLNELPPGLKNIGYELGKQIGEGGFSTVYLATNSRLPGVQLACKVFRLKELHQGWADKFLKQEMKLMTRLHHRNICVAYDVYKTRSRGFIFMKYAANGGMEAYIARHYSEGRLPELPLCRRLFHRLMTAVEYLHSLNVAHRDLKVENFLLDEDLEPMITDFGFSVIDKSDAEVPILCNTVCGSTQYTAPELRLLAIGDTTAKSYDAKSADIYSMGVCLYEILHGYRPYEGQYDMRSKELARRQLACDYHISRRLRLSRECQQLIRQMLEPKVAKRPSARTVLKHAWFRGERASN